MTEPASIPLPVAGGLRLRIVSANGLHTCGISLGDVAYCWGSNSVGQLGDGTRGDRYGPVRVAGQ